jgi:hypothetical protein
MNEAPMIMPAGKTEIVTIKEEVYKSALEVIKSLCDSYSISTSDIKAICETVLKTGGNTDEQ